MTSSAIEAQQVAEPGTFRVVALQTANRLCLAIWLVAMGVAFDWWLFGAGLFCEAVYLCLALHPRYRERLKARPRAKDPLDPVLLVVTVAGILTTFFFGFCIHLLNNNWRGLTHAARWEAGAIIWTGLFLIYYLPKFETAERSMNILAVMGLLLLGGGLLAAAWLTMTDPAVHLACLWILALFFVGIDLLQMKTHRNRPNERERSRSSLYWADLPMLFSFSVLLIYLLVHHDAEHQEVFVSGVVACQLLFSNSVFVVMEFAVFLPPEQSAKVQRLDREAEPRQSDDVRRPETGANIGIPLDLDQVKTHAADQETAGRTIPIPVPGLDSKPV